MRLLPVQLITPLHAVKDWQRHDRLAASMRKQGWLNSYRPLVVVESDKAFLALTGAHRFHAAKSVGLKLIPCFVIEQQRFEATGLDYDELRILPDSERASRLEKVGLSDAANEIQKEIDCNALDVIARGHGKLDYS